MTLDQGPTLPYSTMQALAIITRGIKPLLLALVLVAGQSLAAYGAMPCCPENASSLETSHSDAHQHDLDQAAHSHNGDVSEQSGGNDTCDTVCCGTCMPFADFAFASNVKSLTFGLTSNLANDEQLAEARSDWVTPPPKN